MTKKEVLTIYPLDDPFNKRLINKLFGLIRFLKDYRKVGRTFMLHNYFGSGTPRSRIEYILNIGVKAGWIYEIDPGPKHSVGSFPFYSLTPSGRRIKI